MTQMIKDLFNAVINSCIKLIEPRNAEEYAIVIHLARETTYKLMVTLVTQTVFEYSKEVAHSYGIEPHETHLDCSIDWYLSKFN